MPTPRDVLTPDALAMLQTVASTGSFAAAARALNLVPSALSYRVRLIEEALDVLLFDRGGRQARITEAGGELLREASRLLGEIDAVAHRVKRVATGWEPMLTLAVDSVIARDPLLDLVGAFYALEPSTRLKLRDETLMGTIEALTSGEADLAIGAVLDAAGLNLAAAHLRSRPLGELRFIYAVAPHHPLARIGEPLSDMVLRQHRAVAAADSSRAGPSMTLNLIGGQDVLAVPTVRAKLAAQLHGLGGGFLPEPMARPYIEAGRLVECPTVRPSPLVTMHCAWRVGAAGQPGQALQWWIRQFEGESCRRALLEGHRGR
jgi:DNA-binding transcriptional LysR family regulator